MQVAPSDQDRAGNEALKRQIQALRSGNRGAVLASLEEIRSSGHVSLLPVIFDLLLDQVDQDDQEVLEKAAQVLNDLKAAEAAPVLARAVNREEYRPVQHLLVAACWQNGLNYGPYAEVFVKAALEGSLETCIEAFSVLEEAAGELDLAGREKLARQLRHGLPGTGEDKKALLSELIKVIDQFQRPDKFRVDPD